MPPVYMAAGKVVRNGAGSMLAVPPAPAPPPPAAPPAGDMPSFSLLRSSSGTAVPFALGQVFRKGAVPSGQAVALSTASYQVSPISVWDDGSLKHALVAGKTDLTGNTVLTVATSIGSAPGGSNLTESDLDTALPGTGNNAVTYGSAGTVDLANLVGTSALVLSEHVGPVYAAFQYMATFPSDSALRAIFYVQLWQGGAYRVRVAVEHGNAQTGTPSQVSKSGTATVVIAGSTVLNQAVNTMLEGMRWDAVGATFTLPGYTHDVEYLRATKLFPNIGYTGADNTTLNTIVDTYAPLDRMRYEQDQGGGGFSESIGLVTHWEALYLATGDGRARDASLDHGRAYGCYGIFLRDMTTSGRVGRMPAFSDWPTADYADEQINQISRGGNRWEKAHFPNAGYVPWLMSAERFYLEVLQANAWAAYYTNSNGAGGNASRLYVSETRSRGWRLRTIGCAAAVGPTSETFTTAARTNFNANIANWKTVHVDANFPPTGIIGTYDDQESGTAGLQRTPFENFFIVSSLGLTWDIEPQQTSANTTQKTAHQAVRDFSYRMPVGMTGPAASASDYDFRRATGIWHGLVVGPNNNDTSTFYSTWNEIYDATYGSGLAASPNTIRDDYADDASANAFPQGNWGHLITCLSYAVDHGAAGAQAGYDRVTGASNWSSNATKFNNYPQQGVVPRIPQWYGLMSAGAGKNLGGSYLDAASPHQIGYFSGNAASVSEQNNVGVFSYSGGFVSNSSFHDRNGTLRRGAALGLFGGGHNASGDNSVTMFRLYDQTWYRIRDSYASGVYSTSENADGTPNSRHSYQSIVHVPLTNELFSAITGARLSTDGSSSDYCHSFDFNDTAPNGSGPGPWTREDDFPYPGFTMERTGLAACYDS